MQQRSLVLVFCTIMWFANQFVRMALPILLVVLVKEFSLSYTDAGILVTAYLVVNALMQFPTGNLANRVGSKKILTFGVGFFSASSLFTAISTSYPQFFTLQLLSAIGSGCHLSVATALISNLFSEHERGRAIGTHESAVSLGSLLSSLITLPVALLLSWRFTYLIYGVFGLLLTGAVWKLMPNIEGFEKRATKSQPERKEFTGHVLMLFAVLTLHIFVYQALYAFLPSYISAEKRIPFLYLGYYLAVPHILGVFGRPLGGHISDRIGRRRMTLISLASLAFGLLLSVFTQGEHYLLIALVLLGFGLNSAIPVLFAFLTGQFSPSRRAIVLGRFNTIRLLIAASSPVIVGAVIDSTGFFAAYLALILAVLVSFFLTLKAFKKDDS